MATEFVYIEAPDGQIFSGEYGTIPAESEDGKKGHLIISPSWTRLDGSRIVVDPETGDVSGGNKITEADAEKKLRKIAETFDERASDLAEEAISALRASAEEVYSEALSVGFSSKVALLQARTILPTFEAP